MGLVALGIFFLSSYAPLLLLFAVLGSFRSDVFTAISGILSVAGIVAFGFLLLLLRRNAATYEEELLRPRNRDQDVTAYVVTYVIPFAALVVPATGDDASREIETTRWALFVFLAIVAVLYLRAATYYVHPLLLMAGIHVYEASRHGGTVIVLTRERYVREVTTLHVKEISHNVFWEVRR